ncbi:hypothetical protein DS831_04570 [Bombilactobacillus bombi]|uniref:Uncharacterized protein n=1 Tax=Bombilactobacillus bombi TaxID=1303590 RepID=A0A417ZI83_9LACO|nr:hypothetical protein [Bombilactobacillus bombi]RHW51300.1 hypothetical protein DS831_04570 [Bombilactobacillus bombi]
MTVRVLNIGRGFNTAVKVGDSLMFEGKLYVIIALNIKMVKSQNWDGECVAQLVGSSRVSPKYKTAHLEQIIEGKADFLDRHEVIKLGTILHDSTEGIAYRVSKINSVKYKFVDLFIDFEAEIIDEWTTAEIDEALKADNKCRLKVISGSGKDELVSDDRNKPNLKLIKEQKNETN